jgi:hypothetical protein
MRKLLIACVVVASFALAAQQPAPTPPSPLERAQQLQRGVGQLVDALTPPATAPAPQTHVINVPAGGKLQAAIDAAQPGDTIALTPGAVYTGTFILRKKDGATTITITTAGDMPPGRMTIAAASSLAKVESGTTLAAITTATAAHDYVLRGLEIRASAGKYPVGLVRIGAGDASQSSLDQVPTHVTIDRCYIHGDAATGAKRGVDANGADLTVRDSYIADIKGVGQDTNAIGGINGPGPFLIENNYLEAAGENVIFGGGDPFVPNLIPSDIVIRGNTITKPVDWRGQKWSIKNLLELKNAQRVHISANVIEHVWLAAQTGFAILITVRNQSGRCPWCTVRDVEFDHNVVRHASQGIQILGLDDEKNATTGLVPISVRAQGLSFHDNLFYDIDRATWGGDSSTRMITMASGPAGVAFVHNTFVGNVGGLLSLSVGRTPTMARGLIVRCNVAPSGAYPIKASNLGTGTASWAGTTDATSVFVDNALQPPSRKVPLPAGNRVAAMTFDASFMPTPSFACADGTHAGVDVAALLAAIPGLDLAK